MRFSIIENEINNESAKNIIDSVLNVGYSASIVIDKNTFEIIYQNRRAADLLGQKVNCLCHEVFCTNEVPCIDCPILALGKTPIIRTRYEEFFDEKTKWQYNTIEWFDGRQAVLATLLEIGDEQDIIAKSIAQKVAFGIDVDKRETDSLTHIPNYSKFYSNTENKIRKDINKDYAIVVFDIDRFKSINDLYGMSKGDETLKHISKVLKDVFGYADNYARMHSDMFAFYMSYEKKGDIIREIEKLRKRIAANEFEFDINTSFGIYLIVDRNVPINLMCDRAMMASRTIKGNIMRFCSFYDEQYREDMLKTNEIERDMNKALENRDFKMYLQPKYKLSDGSLCGAEVLCRWKHPNKGIIPPLEFIPLFEKNGFILKLDEYMWEEACKTLKDWINEDRKPIPLSVNISRYHIIGHNDLESILTRLINSYGLSSDLLTLEITESLFLDKPEELNRVLVRLQKLGFKFEVDDFGAGFSSLNLIRNINVDTIKIDKDFLDNEIASEKGKIVVNHTIDMAKDLKLQVVAEGVETKEHLDFLKNSRCDIAQGFYFAKPMPLIEFNNLCF